MGSEMCIRDSPDCLGARRYIIDCSCRQPADLRCDRCFKVESRGLPSRCRLQGCPTVLSTVLEEDQGVVHFNVASEVRRFEDRGFGKLLPPPPPSDSGARKSTKKGGHRRGGKGSAKKRNGVNLGHSTCVKKGRPTRPNSQQEPQDSAAAAEPRPTKGRKVTGPKVTGPPQVPRPRHAVRKLIGGLSKTCLLYTSPSPRDS